MDRGVKVAIFVASVVSLGLGLIWDQVLSQARVAVENTSPDEFAAEIIDGRIGSPDIPRLDAQEEGPPGVTTAQVSNDRQADVQEVEPTARDTGNGYTEYTVRPNDSFWVIVHKRFPDRGLKVKDVQRANPDVAVPQPGQKLKIPLNAENAEVIARTVSDEADSESVDPGLDEWAEYEVQSGDNWWSLAYERFRKRGHNTATLQQANPEIEDLKPGQVIKIPPAS